MVNDYYIVKVLHIYYNETVYIVHELDESHDIDNTTVLTPEIEPILIYEKDNFLEIV